MRRRSLFKHIPAEKKLTQMTETPVKRLISTLAVPTILSMLVTSIYNMADTYFVSEIGISATAAVGVTLPVMTLFSALGITFGQGSGTSVSRLLGQKRQEEAETLISVAFFSSLLVGGLLAIAGIAFLESLVELLGATSSSAPYAQDYLRIVFGGAPFIIASVVLNNQFRFQGNAAFGTVGILSGAVLNIALDPLFIFGLSLGIKGAAWATVLSQLFSFCLLVAGTRGGSNIRVSYRKFLPSRQRYRMIVLNGTPSFCRQAFASIAAILLNTMGKIYGGDVVVAAMTIVSRVTLFATYIILGFGQGYQPVCGFNYGARLYHRVHEGFWFFVKTALVISAALSVVGFIFAPEIIAAFQDSDPEVIRIGAAALRLQCVIFPAMAWITPVTMTLQTIGYAYRAIFLSMCQKGLLFIPLVLLLPGAWGIFGIQVSQPLADLLTLAAALPLGIGVVKDLYKKSGGKQEE